MNRFGTFLGLAHAAMTAEGDNSVLMQKVAKERLGEISKEGFEILNDTNNAGMDVVLSWYALVRISLHISQTLLNLYSHPLQ